MRIVNVVMGLPKAAGTSVFCGELANGLVALGHDVTIAVCDPSAKDVYPLDVRVHLTSIESVLTTFPSTLNSQPTTLNSQLSTHNPQLIHIHALWSPLLHRVSSWARQNHIPVVWSPHGMITPWAMNNKRWKKLLAWYLYQKRDLASAALLHATAQSEVEDIRRMGLKNKVVVAPLGVHLRETEGQRSEVRGQTAERRTLLFVSRVQRKKGLPMLLEALARIKQSNSETFKQWTLRIVGPDQEGHTAELKAQCDTLGLSYQDESLPHSNNQTFEHSNIVFVGPKFGDDLQREYASADLFVLPTHSENFGSVVIESLAHGVPVICTKGAPWKELNEHGCGEWVDVDETAIEGALVKMVSMSDGDRVRMGANGRRLVKENYTWETVARSLLESYKGVL